MLSCVNWEINISLCPHTLLRIALWSLDWRSELLKLFLYCEAKEEKVIEMKNFRKRFHLITSHSEAKSSSGYSLTKAERKQTKNVLETCYNRLTSNRLNLFEDDFVDNIEVFTNRNTYYIKELFDLCEEFDDWIFRSFLAGNLILADEKLVCLQTILFFLSSEEQGELKLSFLSDISVPGTYQVSSKVVFFQSNTIIDHLFGDIPEIEKEKKVSYLKGIEPFLGKSFSGENLLPKLHVLYLRMLQTKDEDLEDVHFTDKSFRRDARKLNIFTTEAKNILEIPLETYFSSLNKLDFAQEFTGEYFNQLIVPPDHQLLEYFLEEYQINIDFGEPLNKQVRIYVAALFRVFLRRPEIVQFFLKARQEDEENSSFLKECGFLATFLVAVDDIAVLKFIAKVLDFRIEYEDNMFMIQMFNPGSKISPQPITLAKKTENQEFLSLFDKE